MKKYLPFLCVLAFLVSCKKESILVPEPPELPKEVSGLPILITNPQSDLTRFSVRITGTLKDTGYSKVTEAGFVVDTISEATVDRKLNKFIRTPDQNGDMLAIITSIPGNKTYYLRAYAKNTQGIGYGNEIRFTALSTNIFNGNVTLSSQQEVVAFGSKQYTGIGGTLEIRGTVNDLTPLKNLAFVSYAVNITFTSQLTTLKGLDSLEAANVDGFFHGMRIQNNTALKSLTGLNRLIGNSGDFIIINNDQLTDLNGLQNFGYIHFGEFRIEGCENIKTLAGMEKFGILDGNLVLKDNPSLTDITSLSNLSTITERVKIINNAQLRNLNGLEKLHKLDGIEFYDNKLLSDIKGFRNLDTVKSIILCRNNAALKDFAGLEKLKTTEYITIDDSPGLTSLNGFQNLQYVTHKIQLWQTGLTNLQGLNNLVHARTIEIFSNLNLLNLQGMDKLTTLTQDGTALTVTRNPLLSTLNGLQNLKSLPAGGISMEYNTTLKDYCALKPLIAGGWSGNLYIQGNAINPTKADVLAGCP